MSSRASQSEIKIAQPFPESRPCVTVGRRGWPRIFVKTVCVGYRSDGQRREESRRSKRGVDADERRFQHCFLCCVVEKKIRGTSRSAFVGNRAMLYGMTYNY